MNYFEYHGASFWDDRRIVLENAMFCQDIMNVVCYLPKINPKLEKSHLNYYSGEFLKREETSSWKFVYKNKLYSFGSDRYGRIKCFHELNTSKNECLNGNDGCYYQFEMIENQVECGKYH